MNIKYLPGLDSLRFFAAFFVIISHANQSIMKLGITLPMTKYPVFEKGPDAVDFFFTLSGFLITFLLIFEKGKTGDISIKKFYLRRVFRIWPLYFIVLALGFAFFAGIYPIIYKENYFTFGIWQGLLLFILFLPNWMAKNYSVGLLNPLWSIGVEEQFYLFWAPLMKFRKNKTLPLICGFIAFATLLSYAVNFNLFPIAQNWRNFLCTLKFHNMAIGSLFAYVLYFRKELYINSVLSHKLTQAGVVFTIGYHYFHGISFLPNPFQDIFMSLLYGMLILNVSSIPNKLIQLEIKPLVFLGRISYGLYMYHMLVDYVLRFSLGKIIQGIGSGAVAAITYHALLLGMTIAVAAISFLFIEKFCLNLKQKFG